MGRGTNRTENAFRNMIFGSVLKLYQTIVPFFMRTLMIQTLGVEYLGLNSLFTSILQILNLAELGISQAMTFCMYKPIVQKDKGQICELLGLYRLYYFIIGLVILVFGIILLPFLPQLITGHVPQDIDLYFLYCLYLLSTVMSYWLFSYRNSLLEAHQRNDILSKIHIFTFTLQFVVQVLALLVWKNYYLYIVVQLFVQIFQQLINFYFVKKIYPEYQPSRKINHSYKQQISKHVKDIATAKFGAVILNSSDTIVISAFLGLSALAIYQNYFYLITAVVGFISTLLYGSMASIGNCIVIESKEKVYSNFLQFTFILSWIVCVCTCCFFCLFQPFMELWVGEELMLHFSAVVLFCVYFFVYEYNQLFNLYKDAAGLWHQDRFRPLITSLINLILNIILVRWIGIYGVLLSTVISIFLVGMPWLLGNIFNELFKRTVLPYLKKLTQYTCIVIVSCCFSSVIANYIDVNGWLNIIFRLIISVVLPSCLYSVLFRKTQEFQNMLSIVKRLILKK